MRTEAFQVGIGDDGLVLGWFGLSCPLQLFESCVQSIVGQAEFFAVHDVYISSHRRDVAMKSSSKAHKAWPLVRLPVLPAPSAVHLAEGESFCDLLCGIFSQIHGEFRLVAKGTKHL